MKAENIKDLKEQTIIKKGEDAGFSMTYHGIMFGLKFFFAVRSFWDLVTTFMNEMSVYRTIDQVFYLILLAVSVFSLWKHDHKTGVYAVLAFAGIDLIFQIAVLLTAGMQGITIPDPWLEYLWFAIIVIWGVATALYYKKRWSILK